MDKLIILLMVSYIFINYSCFISKLGKEKINIDIVFFVSFIFFMFRNKIDVDVVPAFSLMIISVFLFVLIIGLFSNEHIENEITEADINTSLFMYIITGVLSFLFFISVSSLIIYVLSPEYLSL